MKSYLQALIAKGDALSQRERTILFCLLLAGTWALIDLTLMSPLLNQRKAETERMQAVHERMQRAQDMLAEQSAKVPPNLAAQQRLEAARQAFSQRMAAAGQVQNRLVAPKAMLSVLQGLTRNQPGLRLVSLNTLAPVPVLAAPASSAATPANMAGLYKHGVTLTVAGSYDTLLRYMASIERLPVGFYWQSAALDAQKHPDITLTLTLHTLSLEPEWLTL